MSLCYARRHRPARRAIPAALIDGRVINKGGWYYTDAPGGGAYGDATVLLRAMIAADLRDTAVFSDAPIEAEAEVLRLSDGAYVHDGP